MRITSENGIEQECCFGCSAYLKLSDKRRKYFKKIYPDEKITTKKIGLEFGHIFLDRPRKSLVDNIVQKVDHPSFCVDCLKQMEEDGWSWCACGCGG